MSPRLTIEEHLLAAQVAINNALNQADILASLSLFGYDEAKLNAGKTLLTEAETLVNQQRVEYGEQYQASQAYSAARSAADKAYKRVLKVARVALKGNEQAATALMLNGRRKKTFSGWREQANALYTNLLNRPDLLAEMTTYGYDQPKLEAEQALVAAAEGTNLTHEAEKGDAQAATKARDAALDALDEWLDDFREIAEVALEDDPQQLEALGFGAVA